MQTFSDADAVRRRRDRAHIEKAGFRGRLAGTAFKEIGGAHAKHPRNVPEPARPYSVQPLFILLNLLETHANRNAKLLLGDAKNASPLPQANADMFIDDARRSLQNLGPANKVQLML